MKAIFFARVVVPHVGFQEVVDSYASWTLGVGAYQKSRHRRRETGVPPGLTPAQLGQGGSFRGGHDCTISSRSGDERFALRFVHRDSEDGGILWHTAVRLERSGAGCVVEHAVARSGPKGSILPPVAASPTVLVRLIARNGREIEPRDLWDTDLLDMPEQNVDEFVSHILLDDERRVPYLFVAPTNDTGDYLVAPNQLAKDLAALARVVAFTDKAAAFRFTAALRRRRFANEFGVSNGSVRLFHPGLQPRQSHLQHYLWLRRRIEALPDGQRVRAIAGEAASRIVERTLPIGFFDLIEERDRRSRQRAAGEVLKASMSSPQLEVDALRAAVAERDGQISRLKAALEAAEFDLLAESEKYGEEEGKRRAAEGRSIELELQLDEQRDALEHQIEVGEQRIGVLTLHLESMKTQRAGAALPADVREALDAVCQGQPSVEQCLLAIVALYPDRISVLPSAIRAARESQVFKRGREAFRLLRTLATDYWQALQQGKGDGQARGIFGDNYAAKESQTVEGNRRAKEARTFVYGDEPLLMLKHLKIGVKDSLAETLRIHFEWIARERRIVIGHCGGHLPFG